MSKKLSLPLTLLVLLSLTLGACSFTSTPDQPVVEVGGDPLGGGGSSGSSTTLDVPALLAGFWAGVPASSNYGSVGAEALSVELVEAAPFLVDVRQPSEIEAHGYIVGAVNLTIRELLKNLDKLPGLDDPIVVYCDTGHRSAFGMMALRLLGYTNVRSLNGGTSAWGKAGLPFITGSQPAEAATRSSVVISNELLYTTLNTFLTNQPEGYLSVKVETLAAELAGSPPALIDLRTQSDWDAGHLQGSLMVEFSTLLDNLSQLPADTSASIVVYDSSGHRGALVTEALRLLGYTNVRNLTGGYFAWKAAGLTVVP